MRQTVRFVLRLFIAENAPNSVLALANLRAICKTHLSGAHEIEVVDVFAQPSRAVAEQIVMTPTLVVVQPGTRRRLVGNLGDTAAVLGMLGLGSTA